MKGKTDTINGHRRERKKGDLGSGGEEGGKEDKQGEWGEGREEIREYRRRMKGEGKRKQARREKRGEG